MTYLRYKYEKNKNINIHEPINVPNKLEDMFKLKKFEEWYYRKRDEVFSYIKHLNIFRLSIRL